MRTLIVRVFALLLLAIVWLMLVDGVKAGGYYYPSYNYYQSYSYYTPIYKEVPYYKEYPVYKEVTIPRYVTVPLYSVYLDPNAYQQPQQQAAKAPCNGMSANTAPAAASTAHAPTTDACAVTKAKLDRVEAQMELLLKIMGNSNVPPPGADRSPTPPKERNPKEPAPPPKAPAPKKPEVKEPTSTEIMQRGVNVMHLRCASCHESKVAATEGGNFVIFVNQPDGKSNVANLTERQWAKIETEIGKGMPPKKDSKGNPVPRLEDGEEQAVRDMLVTRKTLVKAGEGG